MKPCSKNRKLIAWLALDALGAREAAALRAHLAGCEGCRRYWEEMSNVAERVAAAAPDCELEASESFHRRVAGKLAATETSSFRENLAAWFRGSPLLWRVAVPTSALLGITLFAMVALWPFTPAAPLAPTGVLAVPPSGDLAPTLSNYQMIANESPEKLGELLTRQGNRRLPKTPMHLASGLELANATF